MTQMDRLEAPEALVDGKPYLYLVRRLGGEVVTREVVQLVGSTPCAAIVVIQDRAGRRVRVQRSSLYRVD